MLRFGSWIGGDRDGNPFVTPEVTRDAIQLARGHLLLYYQRQLDEIIDLLTTSAPADARQRGSCSSASQAYVAQVHTPEAQVFGEQYEFEYYRRFVICLKARIQRTLEQPGDGQVGGTLPVTPYTLARRTRTSSPRRCPPTARSQDFLDDLEALRASLAANRGHPHRAHAHRSAHPAGAHLRPASAHARYSPARARSRRGVAGGDRRLPSRPSLPGGLSAETASVLETFRVVAEVKNGCSPEAIRQYVISGAVIG